MPKTRKSNEDRLNAELQFHFEQLIQDYIAAGVDPNEARRGAVLEFGGLEEIKEECRDVRGFHWLQDLNHDLRHACRTLLVLVENFR